MEKIRDFTDEEVGHLTKLNCRLVELTHQVFLQVTRIHKHLQAEVVSGNHDYDTFTIEGEIYIDSLYPENDEMPYDELQKQLIDSVKNYCVIVTNCHQSQSELDEAACRYINWWANWDGCFKELVRKHNVPICRAFKHLLDESHVFAMEDIMKLKPEQFQTNIKIYI